VLSGFDYAQTSEARPKFQVHADRTVGFAQGAGLPSTWYGLEAVTLTLYSAEGEPFKIKSDTAEYDPRTKAMHLKSNVVMTDVSGAVLRTANVDYDPATDMLHVPGPIDMTRGLMRGHASSAAYRNQTRELSLAGPVTAEGMTGAAHSPFSTLRSDRGTYRRTPGEIELDGNVQGTRDADHFSADTLVLHLTPANQVDQAHARGSVAGSVVGAPDRPPENFAGDAGTLDFNAAGKLERILLSGAPATIQTPAASPEAGSRQIEARTITLDYASEVLERATAEGSARMTRDGRNSKGDPVHETIQSDSVNAAFGAAGAVDTARFAGNVVATSPDAIAHAPSALFAAASNSMTFLGDPGRDAEVSAPRGKVVARRIELFSGASRLVATDMARAYLRPSSENRGLPEFLSSSKKPTRARAERIELDDSARTAAFDGGAALWQESNSLFADHVKLFDADRSARAEGSVRTTARSASSSQEKNEPPTTVSSEKMRYSEATRTAHFEERVVAARGPQAAQGESADSRFNEKNQIERTVLSGHVKFSDPATGRRGSGDRAEDEPLARVTTLFGDPAVALDSAGNRISAAILTFRKDSGTVDAKAKDGQKIESVYQTRNTPNGRARGGVR
jgi:lipopolysaccharide export system protein LptA